MGLAGAVTMEVSRLSSLAEGEDSRRHAKVFAKCRHGVSSCSACALGELIDGRGREIGGLMEEGTWKDIGGGGVLRCFTISTEVIASYPDPVSGP